MKTLAGVIVGDSAEIAHSPPQLVQASRWSTGWNSRRFSSKLAEEAEEDDEAAGSGADEENEEDDDDEADGALIVAKSRTKSRTKTEFFGVKYFIHKTVCQFQI